MGKESSLILKVIIISIVFGVISAVITTNMLSEKSTEKTKEQLIKEFYEVENAVHVSPHGIRKHLGDDNDWILVDLRSEEEYLEEHIIGAYNVPAYKDRDYSDYGAVDRIRRQMKELQDANPGKDLIVYCYSIPCMTGRKVGKIVADDGIYVKHLGIGWNEWRYFWNLWNHPHEWNITNVEDYISSGPEPGKFEGSDTGAGCPIEGELGC